MFDSRPLPIVSRCGTSLIELVLVLGVAALILGMAVPGGRRLLDRLAVTAAREEIVGVVHRARAVAVSSGGARVRVDQEAESVWLISIDPSVSIDASVADRVLLAGRGIDLSTSGSAPVVDLTWNSLGWGVVASRTLVLRRGSQEARVVISSRGRATRR